MAPPVPSSLVLPEPGATVPPPRPTVPRPTPVLRAVPRPDPKPKSKPTSEAPATAPPPIAAAPAPLPVIVPVAPVSGVEVIELDVAPDPEPAREIPPAFRREAANDCVAWEPSSLSPITTGERFALKMTDEARLRRAYLARYVKAVVAGCAMLCVVAAVRWGVRAASEPSRASASLSSTVQPFVPPAAPPPPPPVVEPVAAPVAAQVAAPTPIARPPRPIKPSTSSKPRRPAH
jgi:hypothetical protein